MVLIVFIGFGGPVMRQMGPNDATRIVWAIHEFFFLFLLLPLILITSFRYFTSFETMYGVLGAGDEENGPK